MFEKFHRGDIYSADLSPGIGSEQSGSRPVLILQNNVGNCFSPTIIIAAITSVSKKSRKFPTHYHLNDRCGLVKPSVVMLEQIRTIDKSRLKNYIGHLNKDDMENIPQRSILLRRKLEDQPFGAVLVDWLLFQSIIQRLLRFRM